MNTWDYDTVLGWNDTHNKYLRYKFSGYENLSKIYSQCYQDLFALTLVDSTKVEKTYLEIGGEYPLHSNNTYLLSNYFDWYGISIEINIEHQESWNRIRPDDKIFFCDALTVDYNELLKNNFQTTTIDYLQLDIDPSFQTLQVLKKIPTDIYRFGIITFETDAYHGDLRARDESRDILNNLGYTCIAKDIVVPWITGWNSPFEDWWVDLELVNKEIALDIKYRTETENIQNPFQIFF